MPIADPSVKCPRCGVTVPCTAIDAPDRCAPDCPLNALPIVFLHPSEYARIKAAGGADAAGAVRIKIVRVIP